MLLTFLCMYVKLNYAHPLDELMPFNEYKNFNMILDNRKRSLLQLSALQLLKYVVLITAEQTAQRKFDNKICKYAKIKPQHAPFSLVACRLHLLPNHVTGYTFLRVQKFTRPHHRMVVIE